MSEWLWLLGIILVWPIGAVIWLAELAALGFIAL